jgi:hypothetical protein
MSELATEIERYLLLTKGWVGSEVLCDRFGVGDPRGLRGIGRKPGLVSAFAISSDHGYKHVEHATTGEWLRFKARIVYHAVSELRRVHLLQRRRHGVLRKVGQVPTERDTGQTLRFSTS